MSLWSRWRRSQIASFDSVDLLASFNALTGQPTTSAIADAAKYARLAKAQNRVIAKMTPVCPTALYPRVAYGSIPTLTTTDNQIYTFGSTAAGFARFPMGQAGIYASLNDIPDYPLVPNQDYMVEATQIRAMNNGTLPSVLYWYGISQPADITAAVEPVLFPEQSRDLIVIEAARRFAQEFLRNAALVDEMQMEWDRVWPEWCSVWRGQFKAGGALGVWSGMELAITGQY